MGGGASAQSKDDNDLPARFDLADCKRFAGGKYVVQDKVFDSFKDERNKIDHSQFLRALLDKSGKRVVVSAFDYDTCLIDQTNDKSSEMMKTILNGLEAHYFRIFNCSSNSSKEDIKHVTEISRFITIALCVQDLLNRIKERKDSTDREDSFSRLSNSFEETNGDSTVIGTSEFLQSQDSSALHSSKEVDTLEAQSAEHLKEKVGQIVETSIEQAISSSSSKRPVIILIIHEGGDDELLLLATILEEMSEREGRCMSFEWGPEKDIFDDKCNQFLEMVKELTGSTSLCQEEDDQAMKLVFGRPIPRPALLADINRPTGSGTAVVAPGRTVLSAPDINEEQRHLLDTGTGAVDDHAEGKGGGGGAVGEHKGGEEEEEEEEDREANDDDSTIFGGIADDNGSQDGRAHDDPHSHNHTNRMMIHGGNKTKRAADDGVKECPEDDIDDIVLGSGAPNNCVDYRLYRTLKAQTMQPLTSFGITGIIPLRSAAGKKNKKSLSSGTTTTTTAAAEKGAIEDTAFITAGSTDKMLRVWMPEDIHWNVTKEWKAHRNRVFGMTILSNGSLATAGSDRTIQIWSHKSWMFTNRGFIPMAHSGAVWCLCGLRQNMIMVSGGSTNDPTVKVWNMKRLHCQRVLTGHRDGVSAAVELLDGTVATGAGNNDRTIRIWNIMTGECLQTLKGNGQAVTGLALLANGVLVSSGGDMTIRLWNTTKGTLIRVLRGHTAWINCLCVMGDGVTIASGASDKTIRIWNTTVREKKTNRISAMAQEEEEEEEDIKSVDSLHSDGSHTALTRKPKMPTTVCTAVLEGHTNWVSAIATLGDGTTLISGGFDDTIRIWNAPKI